MKRRFRLLLAACAVSAAAIPVARAQADPCATFKWPLIEERQWLQQPDKIEVTGTAQLDAPPRKALLVVAAPAAQVTFALPPSKTFKDASSSALISIKSIREPGTYQVTLSEEAWIDLVQENKLVASIDHSGVRGCQGLRKSVRFALKSGPLSVQLSASSAPRLLMTIRRVAD